MNSTSLSADSQFITKLVEKQTFLFFLREKVESESHIFKQGVGADCLLLKKLQVPNSI
jgi:hypothetical protein